MQKNAPLQSNLHENAFNPHLKLNESLACRITHSYIVQEERGEKSILVYFYACRGAELRSFPNIYPCSVGGLGGRVRWCTGQQQTGNCWAKSTAAGSQLTRQKEWSGRRAQLHRQTSQESWSPVRHSYWTKKKALYFKAVYCWNKINIKLSATLIFLISTSLFFSNGCFHMLLVQSDSLRLIIKNFRELHNRSQGKFKYRPYNPLAIATFIFRHNNLTKPGWKERFTSFILIKSIKDE